MVEFRSFQMFLILMIPFTAAVTQHLITIRVGDEATLPCNDVKDYQDKCDSTTWVFNYLTKEPTVILYENGKIHRDAASNSDRLSVTEKCSLVLKRVSDDDVGRYVCTEYKPGPPVQHSDVYLTVTFRDNIATPPTTTTKEPTTTKRTTKATTRPTTTTKRTTKATTRPPTTKTTKRTTKATSRPTTTTDPAADLPAILIPVGVSAALLIIIVAVIRWKKAKGNNTQLEDNTVDPPDGVSYVSIRYKKKTKNKAQVQGEDDTVTYSTINISSTSAGASNDPRNLYASINKTNR